MLDPQREKVYAWEDTWGCAMGKTLSLAGARTWVRWACGKYGIKPPPVRGHYRFHGGTSFYDPETNSIEFRKRHMNIWVALHEAAHAICDTLLDIDEAHSQQWLGIFMALLEKAKVAPRVALRASADSFSLRYTAASRIGPRRIRKHYRRAARKRRCYTF